ncbi:hypothetical protein DUNSADRAFT_6101 [Dunaliella salina]|uniref:Encoded protein n=1 Tax=Dunaliella salina TaxID=3046 RepID=A0ABQ7H708_DUNSA|nr:hypothetical protein DUNSADRAFT_6101 [Dunaliella salina]|eukprot:KAF5842631.1 hypothetical protein DUNSADRAFT_6101 [Dunaliella salina]
MANVTSSVFSGGKLRVQSSLQPNAPRFPSFTGHASSPILRFGKRAVQAVFVFVATNTWWRNQIKAFA